MRIYYLDDEESLCRLFQDYFDDDDLEVSTFTQSQDAIAACNQSPPDLFFIDYRLHGTTGDVVAKLVNEAIPKILVTGEISCKPEYEFDSIVTKPFKFVQLEEVIRGFKK